MVHEPTIDEIFRIVMIDRHRKVKMSIQLRTQDGDEVPIRETIEKMTQWVQDKMKDEEGNECKQIIMPLMAQAMTGGLNKIMGTGATCAMLAQELNRYSLMHMMTVSFYLFKWIQKKGIKIHTVEVPISDEDIAMYDRVSVASTAATNYQLAGGSGRDAIRQMLKKGHIKKSDLAMLGAEDLEDTEIEEDTDKQVN